MYKKMSGGMRKSVGLEKSGRIMTLLMISGAVATPVIFRVGKMGVNQEQCKRKELYVCRERGSN